VALWPVRGAVIFIAGGYDPHIRLTARAWIYRPGWASPGLIGAR